MFARAGEVVPWRRMRWPDIGRPRPNECSMRTLFERMRDPTDRAAEAEDAQRRPCRDFQVSPKGYQCEIERWSKASELFHSVSQWPPSLPATRQVAENG